MVNDQSPDQTYATMIASRSIRTHRIPLITVVLALVAGCAGVPEAGTHSDAGMIESARLRARGAADSLTTTLLARLTTVMKAQGPAGAVEVCAREAMLLTKQVGLHRGVDMRRVTVRARNQGNVPDAWETATLATFEARHHEGLLAPDMEIVETVETASGPAVRYMRPLIVRDPCLRCHGDAATIDPAVMARITREYPADKATGYVSGDLRGAISVTVPVAR